MSSAGALLVAAAFALWASAAAAAPAEPTDEMWAASATWSPLAVTLVASYAVFGAVFYAAAYSVGVYLRHALAFALGVVAVAFAVDFSADSMSKPIAIVIMVATGVICVVLVHFFRWARYLFIGYYVGMLLSLALPDLCVVSMRFGALAFPSGIVVGLMGVYYGYKAILVFAATLGATWLLKAAAVAFLPVYRTHFQHRAAASLAAYFFPNSVAPLPRVPFFVPLALVVAALVLAVPRVAVGVSVHRHRKSASGNAASAANAPSLAKQRGASSLSARQPSPAANAASSPTLAGSAADLSGRRGLAPAASQSQLSQSQRSPSSSSIASIRKSGSTASMSSLSARQRAPPRQQ